MINKFRFVELVRMSVKVEATASTFLTMWRIILMDCDREFLIITEEFDTLSFLLKIIYLFFFDIT